MNWTTDEIRYLEEHAGDGAVAVAEHLGRSVVSVQVQASRYGVSLTPRGRCPKCGALSRKPLSGRTGWCAECTKEARREELAREVMEMEEELRRSERNDRERQKLYSRKSRLKKKLQINENE